MIVRTLAVTAECRDGSCPTAYLTERGTIVVQGFIDTAATEATVGDGLGLVEVPTGILERAAAAIRDERAMPPLPVPAPRGSGPAIWPVAGDAFVVRGHVTSSDIATLKVPAGEGAVEVPGEIVLSAVATHQHPVKEGV